MHTLYGCTFTISKILIKHAPPIFVIGVRMIIAGIILSLYANLFSKSKNTLDRTSLFYILQIAIFGIYFPYVLRYWALQYLPVTKTALIYNISPFAAYFFSYLFFKEKVTFKKWLGLIIGFAGIIPMLVAHSPSEATIHGFAFLSWAEIAMLVSVSCFSYGWVIMKKLVLHKDISPAKINGFNMLIGGTLALGTASILEAKPVIEAPLSFGIWLAIIILITNLICYNLYAILLKQYSATLIALAGLLAPVSAAITSWLYFGETLSWDLYLSGVLVLIGFLLFYLEELKIEKEAEQEDPEKYEEISE